MTLLALYAIATIAVPALFCACLSARATENTSRAIQRPRQQRTDQQRLPVACPIFNEGEG